VPSNRTIGDTDGPVLRKIKETQVVSSPMDVEVMTTVDCKAHSKGISWISGCVTEYLAFSKTNGLVWRKKRGHDIEYSSKAATHNRMSSSPMNFMTRLSKVHTGNRDASYQPIREYTNTGRYFPILGGIWEVSSVFGSFLQWLEKLELAKPKMLLHQLLAHFRRDKIGSYHSICYNMQGSWSQSTRQTSQRSPLMLIFMFVGANY
jgi:hypothetical protein